jgi:putative aldouronate transport system substrate-binding protein
MYESYGDGLLNSATFDGKLYAFPDTVIDNGSMLLWMREDWIEELGLEEPETLEEAMEIVRQFVKSGHGGGRYDGRTCLQCGHGGGQQDHIWCESDFYRVWGGSRRMDAG